MGRRRALLQSLLYLAVLKKAEYLSGSEIYFSYSKDFRGRIYANSILHPMYNRAVRGLLIIDEAELNVNSAEFLEDLKESQYYKHIKDHVATAPIIKGLGLERAGEADKYIYSTILLEVGKLNKKKLIKPEGTTVSEFILEGYNIMNSYVTHG